MASLLDSGLTIVSIVPANAQKFVLLNAARFSFVNLTLPLIGAMHAKVPGICIWS